MQMQILGFSWLTLLTEKFRIVVTQPSEVAQRTDYLSDCLFDANFLCSVWIDLLSFVASRTFSRHV